MQCLESADLVDDMQEKHSSTTYLCVVHHGMSHTSQVILENKLVREVNEVI